MCQVMMGILETLVPWILTFTSYWYWEGEYPKMYSILILIKHLVGGWTNPPANILVKLDHFPRDRGENKTDLKPTPRTHISIEQRKKPSYFPLYWMVNRDPYNGLL